MCGMAPKYGVLILVRYLERGRGATVATGDAPVLRTVLQGAHLERSGALPSGPNDEERTSSEHHAEIVLMTGALIGRVHICGGSRRSNKIQ